MEPSTISLILVSFLLVSAAPACAETDEEYWKRMQEEAHKMAAAAYNPDPMSEISSFNGAVHKYVTSHLKLGLVFFLISFLIVK